MNKLLGTIAGALITIAALAGCATVAPQVSKCSSNYLEKGMVSSRTRDGEFYMAIGQVDLYERGFWGGLRPSGRTVDIAVVIQADKDTGQVLRIATLQPQDPDSAGSPSSYQNGVTLTNGSPYALGDLRGGISIIDMQSYPRWLDALEAMRKAIADLGTYSNYGFDAQQHYLVTVVRQPVIDIGFGMWGWGWPHHRFLRLR